MSHLDLATAPSFVATNRKFLKWVRKQPNYNLLAWVQREVSDEITCDTILNIITNNKDKNTFSFTVSRQLLCEKIFLIKKVLAIRAKTQKIAADCCATAVGFTYKDTNGWHIIPMVTENNTVGLVNIADGVALDTGVKLSRDCILECSFTVSSLVGRHTATESHHASFPDNWRQLVADSRGGTPKLVSKYMPNAKIVKTGLMTCYQTVGDQHDCFEILHDYKDTMQSPLCRGYL